MAYAKRGDNEGYTAGNSGHWFQPMVWMTSEPGKQPQYRKYGQTRILHLTARFPTASEAAQWLEIMANADGPVAETIEYEQVRVVSPWPVAWSGPYDCARAPGMDAIKNVACGRWSRDRDPLELEIVAVSGGWYIARWPWGVIYAGRNIDDVRRVGRAFVEAINENGAITFDVPVSADSSPALTLPAESANDGDAEIPELNGALVGVEDTKKPLARASSSTKKQSKKTFLGEHGGEIAAVVGILVLAGAAYRYRRPKK